MDLTLNENYKESKNCLFTGEEVSSLFVKHESKSSCLNLLKKILLLSDEFIYTKAIVTELILSNNPDQLTENCDVINEVFKMRAVAKDKINTVINKFYKVNDNNTNDSYEIILSLYIWTIQESGIDINEGECFFLWSTEKHEDNTYLKLNPSFMDEIVTLCNGDYDSKMIASILEHDYPLYDVLVELLGEKQVLKSMKC